MSEQQAERTQANEWLTQLHDARKEIERLKQLELADVEPGSRLEDFIRLADTRLEIINGLDAELADAKADLAKAKAKLAEVSRWLRRLYGFSRGEMAVQSRRQR